MMHSLPSLLPHAGALFQQQIRLAQVVSDHAVGDDGIEVRPNEDISGLEVELTTQASELSGMVADARGDAFVHRAGGLGQFIHQAFTLDPGGFKLLLLRARLFIESLETLGHVRAQLLDFRRAFRQVFFCLLRNFHLLENLSFES